MTDLSLQLSQLEFAQLVRHLAEEEPAYIFKHVLTQDAAYQSLLQKQRREIHRDVARAYEAIYEDSCLDDYAAILAQHYAAAGDEAKTRDYAIRAAELALRTNANAEAAMYFGRAIEIVKRGRVETFAKRATSLLSLYLKRGRALELCGQYFDALSNYTEMYSVARESKDRVFELAAMMARATLHATPTRLQNLELGRTLLDGALALAREVKDRAAESKALWNLMIIEYFSGHPAQSVEYGEQALGIARELNLPEQIAYILNDISRNYAALGRVEDALGALSQARELWKSLGNLPMLVDNLGTSADNAVSFGNYAQALLWAEESHRLSIQIGNLWNQAYSQWVLGSIYYEQGRFKQAVETLTATMQMGDESGFVVATWAARVILAWLYGSVGLATRGITLLAPFVDQVRPVDVPFKAWGLGVLALLYLQTGNLAQAETLVAEASRDPKREDLANMVAIIVTLCEGSVAMAHRQYEQVEPSARALLQQYESTKIHIYKADLMLLTARALHALGKIDAARAMLAQAKTEAETVGTRRVLWEILAEWSNLETESGNAVVAQTLRTQAREIVDFILEHAPDDLREPFLNLPRVRQIMEQS
ncbi:MAG: hypothetical protein HZB51_00060 [Chloroflexi bacterium]|nr:hypothetical protein [Chloroflexota bacterium]